MWSHTGLTAWSISVSIILITSETLNKLHDFEIFYSFPKNETTDPKKKTQTNQNKKEENKTENLE